MVIYGESRKGSGTPRFFPVVPLNMLKLFNMLYILLTYWTWPRWTRNPSCETFVVFVLLGFIPSLVEFYG
jgi:hypothetical protein